MTRSTEAVSPREIRSRAVLGVIQPKVLEAAGVSLDMEPDAGVDITKQGLLDLMALTVEAALDAHNPVSGPVVDIGGNA